MFRLSTDSFGIATWYRLCKSKSYPRLWDLCVESNKKGFDGDERVRIPIVPGCCAKDWTVMFDQRWAGLTRDGLVCKPEMGWHYVRLCAWVPLLWRAYTDVYRSVLHSDWSADVVHMMKSCVLSDLLLIASNGVPCFETSKLQGKASKLFYEMIQKLWIVLLANEG